MKLTNVTPKNRPDLFFLEDPLNEGTFDQVFLEDTSVSNGKGILRRAKSSDGNTPTDQMANARIENITGQDHFFVDLYYDSQLVATYELQPQYWFTDHWEQQEVTGTVAIDNELGKMTCTGSQGGFSWDVEINFAESTKWKWNVTAPGFTVRLAWIIQFTELGQQMLADGDLQFGYNDFTGNVSDDEGVVTRTIIFEPDGIDATSGWVVDPYLAVTTTSTTCNIYTSEWEIEFDSAKGGIIDVWYQDGGSTNYADATNGLLDHFINDGTERPQHSMTATLEVLVNLTTYVLLRFAGNITTNVPFVQYVSIRDGGWLFFDTRVTNNTGGSITGTTAGVRIKTDSTNYASDTEIADNSNDATPTYNTEYWFGQYATGLDSVVCGILGASTDAQQDTYASAANSNEYRKDTVTFTNGSTYNHSCVLYIGGASQTEANLQADIDQYCDRTDATINTGTAVTDLVIPDNLDTDGLSSDGARHVESDSGDAGKITFNQTEKRPSLIIPNWTFKSGSTPDEHLVGYWKCDDTGVTTDVVDETGNYDGTASENVSGLTAANAVRGTALSFDGTDQWVNLSPALAGLTDKNIFTVVMRAIVTGTTQLPIFTIAYSTPGDDYLYIAVDEDAPSVRILCVVNAGAESGATISNIVPSEYNTYMVSCDFNKGFYYLTLNGKVVDVQPVASTWGNTPNIIRIARRLDTVCQACIVDEVKLYNACILPFGGYHIGNGQGLLADIDNPHSDLSWYFDGQAAAAKGGAALASDKNPTNTGGQFVATSPILGTNHWDSNGTGNVLTMADSAEDIIDYNNFSLDIWFNIQTAISGGEYLIDCRDADGSDRISAVFDASGNIDVTYRSNSTDEQIVGNIVCTAGVWHHLRITAQYPGSIHSYINGVENGTAQTIANDWGGGSSLTWYFSEDYNNANGCDVFIQKITFTKNKYTPQIWTNFGKPLWLPLMRQG